MKLINNKPSLFILSALSAMILSVACGRGGGERRDDKDRVTAADDSVSEAAPRIVTLVTSAVRDGDKARFASAVAYPLARPYPLKDITDSAAMVEYYPVLVDDSLKHVIAKAALHRWSNNGFRGWTLDNGEYVWLDDSIYSVNYTSVAEQALRSMLAREEIESLAQPMRQGWVPAFCLYGIDNGYLYRVDMSDNAVVTDSVSGPVDTTPGEDIMVQPDAVASNDSSLYRLAIYRRDDNLHGDPWLTMTGRLVIEGSEGNRIYHFNDTLGDTAEYAYDCVSEDEEPEIVIIPAGQTELRHKVRRAYWRDYLSGSR